MENKRSQRTRVFCFYGLLIALAFNLSYVEAMFPIYLGAPGVKLGLANLASVVGMYTLGVRGAALIGLVRIVLAGLSFGNMFTMVYSLAGGALSLLVMASCRRYGHFTIIGVSVAGGVSHNIGQLAVAALVVENAGAFSYLPVLLAAGTIAGAVIGLLGGIVVERIGGYIKNLR